MNEFVFYTSRPSIIQFAGITFHLLLTKPRREAWESSLHQIWGPNFNRIIHGFEPCRMKPKTCHLMQPTLRFPPFHFSIQTRTIFSKSPLSTTRGASLSAGAAFSASLVSNVISCPAIASPSSAWNMPAKKSTSLSAGFWVGSAAAATGGAWSSRSSSDCIEDRVRS